jgi:hypothetical protein
MEEPLMMEMMNIQIIVVNFMILQRRDKVSKQPEKSYLQLIKRQIKNT